uniref:Mitochondrial inner membrane protease ATP23 n=1 Tax=Scapholeberis mucronata TaxID=202097 RepID=A0A4Y7NKR9_9CRUS|nr:EOG090X0CKN [Scapholeberis mucronata]SVE93858.1 EOG090X0CKN [Scapholeberis mucronata]
MPVQAAETSAATPVDKEDKWGYDLYPERRGEAPKPKWWQVALFGAGQNNVEKTNCERNVYNCFQNSPLVRLMYSALKASGCEIDLRRHIACEICDVKVSGGYDPMLNQVVVCQNIARSTGMVQGILVHEMIHMFDACRHDLDFKNVEHLACTEIRAANLTHCSFLSAMAQGDASFFNVKQQHAQCVKTKAIASVLAVRQDISKEEARAVVDKVFVKCYNDLEPIGRRVRRNSTDMIRAYQERGNYGYE